MSDWLTYRLTDFLPFTLQVYLSAIERSVQAFWALPMLYGIMLLTLLGIGWRLKFQSRVYWAGSVFLVFGSAWLTVGLIYLQRFYAEINWSAHIWQWLAIAQGAVLLAMSVFFFSRKKHHLLNQAQGAGRPGKANGACFFGLVFTGLLVYPAALMTTGTERMQIEVFGLHPIPTAFSSLGLACLISRPWIALGLVLAPLVTLLYFGLEQLALQTPVALSILIALPLCFILILFVTVRTRAAY